MLRDRLLVGVVGGILAILVLLSGNLTVGIVISVISLMALGEMYNVFGFFKKNIFLSVIGYIFGVTILLLANFGCLEEYSSVVLSVFMIILMIYIVLAHKNTNFTDVSLCLFSTLYISIFFSYLILIRNGDNGKYYIWIPIIIAWLSDTMAFTFGKLFGKHKLIPQVSPKKTVEGAVGGVLGGAVFMVIYSLICAYGFNKSVNMFNSVLIGSVGAVISQFGDLAASWIKREHGIKDYGSILPGHGGIMDRFDSVLIVAPFVYYSILVFPLFA